MLHLRNLAHNIEAQLRKTFPKEDFLPKEAEYAAGAFANTIRWMSLETAYESPTSPVTHFTIRMDDSVNSRFQNAVADASGLDLEMAGVAISAIDALLVTESGSGRVELEGVGFIKVTKEGNNRVMEIQLKEPEPRGYREMERNA